MSITAISRIMLNIQNPRLFGNVASTITKNTHSRRKPPRLTAGNTSIGPFVASPRDLGLESDSRFTAEPDVPDSDRPKMLGRNKRLWYELDADWAGIMDSQGDRDMNNGVEVSSDEPVAVLGCETNRFLVVERAQSVISRIVQ